jgi:hypothetical protein
MQLNPDKLKNGFSLIHSGSVATNRKYQDRRKHAFSDCNLTLPIKWVV